MELESLTVFSNIRDDKAITQLRRIYDAVRTGDTAAAVRHYSNFTAQLYPHTASLTDYIRTLVLRDDNFYVKNTAAGMHIADEIKQTLENELIVLQKLASLTSSQVREFVGYEGFLPAWTVQHTDLQSDFMEKLSNIDKIGRAHV